MGSNPSRGSRYPALLPPPLLPPVRAERIVESIGLAAHLNVNVGSARRSAVKK